MAHLSEHCYSTLLRRTWPVALALPFVAFLAWRHFEWYQWKEHTRAAIHYSRNLDLEREQIIQEGNFKKGVIQHYLDKEIGLKEAAEILLELDAVRPITLKNLRANYPAPSDLESEARSLVLLADFRQTDQTARVELKERLRSEFRELFPQSHEVHFSRQSDSHAGQMQASEAGLTDTVVHVQAAAPE